MSDTEPVLIADLEWCLLDAGEAVARAREVLASAVARRNVLIVQARAAGMYIRKIAAVADCSETGIRKVLREGGYGH